MEKETNLTLHGKKNLGTIDISTETIATLAGITAMDCYGIVGMASHNLHDGIAELLHQENLAKGVEVLIEEEDIIVNLYVVVEYGVKINEVAQNVINRVKYVLESQLGIKVSEINVMVQDVHVSLERNK